MPAVKVETGHLSHASIYNAARIAGKSLAEFRELVSRLNAKRTDLVTV
jgi:predicted HTH domain antitoxin